MPTSNSTYPPRPQLLFIFWSSGGLGPEEANERQGWQNIGEARQLGAALPAPVQYHDLLRFWQLCKQQQRGQRLVPAVVLGGQTLKEEGARSTKWLMWTLLQLCRLTRQNRTMDKNYRNWSWTSWNHIPSLYWWHWGVTSPLWTSVSSSVREQYQNLSDNNCLC